MRQNCCQICFFIFSASLLAFCSSAYAQQEFNREQAAKDIAESETFKDCHKGINNFDACNWTIYTGPWSLVATYWGSTMLHPEPDSLQGNPVGYWLYREKGYLQISSTPEILILSDQGKVASKGWKHVAAPGDTPQSTFQRWDVPLATKKFVSITSVVQGPRMGSQFADVKYRWVYSLTPLGAELFKNERIPAPGRNREESMAPAELTGIDLKKTYESKATFFLTKNGGWRLQEDCRGDVC